MTKTQKQLLLDKLDGTPLAFNGNDFKNLVNGTGVNELTFDDLRRALSNLFNINETSLIEQSDVTTGWMGRFNRWTTKGRERKYNRRVKKVYKKAKKGNGKLGSSKTIVAEGDSWFNFPYFIKDIIDWLNENDNYLIYSLAYAGDWLANMIYDGKYIEQLSIHTPDVFLFSAGGNDLVSGNRIALMVNPQGDTPNVKRLANDPIFKSVSPSVKARILNAQKYINYTFYSFLLILKAQYWLICKSLSESEKFKNTVMFTVGYDYGIPSYNKKFRLLNPFQYFVNFRNKTGKWLKRPLLIRNVPSQASNDDDNENLHWCLVTAFVFELNEIFIELANDPDFENLYHIDAREAANSSKDWYDELHLTSDCFKKVSLAFEYAIDNIEAIKNAKTGQKVFRVINKDNYYV